MDEKTESLRTALVEEVARIKEDHTYPDLGRAFQHWAAVNVLGIEDENVADELEGAMGSDGGMDYFHVSEKDKTIEIIQAKFSENRDARVEQQDILKFYEIPRNLLFNVGEQAQRFQKQQNLYKSRKENNYATRLLFVTTASLPEPVKRMIASKNENLSSDTSFECLELKDLIPYVGNPRSPTCTLQLIKNECFVGTSVGAQVKRLVATVPASELKKACEVVGTRTLFSLNPRSFLGHKNKISTTIKTTIEDKPERLWHYNNGVSAICESFHYDEKSGILSIENLKIVNGCQTITTIAGMRDIDPSAGLVLRLSVTTDTEFSEKISEYTNRQNSIKSPDLLSTHPYLIKLEKQFGKYGKFFFARKKGQRSGNHSKKALYEIKNEDAARLKMAYSLESPHLSIQLPESSIFVSELDESGDASTFSDLYKDADPRDFIIPHVFNYLFALTKKRIGKNSNDIDFHDKKNIEFLLKYKIGRYYVIGLIGKIFSSMNENTRNNIVNAIIDSAIKYDTDVINNMVDALTDLLIWVTYVIPEVVGNDNGKILHEQEVYYLRDPLRKDDKLTALYRKRQEISKYTGGSDIFTTKLSEIFASSNAQ